MNNMHPAASSTTLEHDQVHVLANRIRFEYTEMPDLALTGAQVRRLWNLESQMCEAVLEVLLAERFLARSHTGAYIRRRAR
jgi:hypothetical protein